MKPSAGQSCAQILDCYEARNCYGCNVCEFGAGPTSDAAAALARKVAACRCP